MRIANPNSVNLKRKQGNEIPKYKYYIIPEGEKTEIKYFNGVKENSEELGIKPLIEIIPIENEESEQGQSHPKKKIENFNKDLQDGKFVFYPEIDKVCFIVDRDPQNFKEVQFDEFVQQCAEQGYEVYVTNPTFELFLLMHDDKILTLNKDEMLENKRQGTRKGKRFLELKLSEIFGCSKTNLNFEKFKPNIKKAIKNEKAFCEDLDKLKEQLGSNVGKLLESIME